MSISRRHFLATAAVASQVRAQVSPNDRIRTALIGAGGQGSGDTRVSLSVGGVELAAVADIYQGRLTHAKEVWGNQIFTTRDYREVLARPDIDAVIIGTPDHWHQKISVDAMNAGKHVYCEKPMVQRLEDGKDVITAEKRTGKVFQVGSQRVSSIIYQKAKDVIASGAVGELNLVEAWVDRNSAIGAWQYTIPPDASPETVDWDRFLGRAPKVPFEPVRLFRWRNYRDYGTGVAGDLFVHLISGLHFVTNSIGPSRVYATGELRYWKDGRDVPDVMLALFDYPKFNLMLRVNFVDGGVPENQGFRFIGSEGVVTIGGGGVTVSRVPRAIEPGYTVSTFPQALQDQYLKEYREKYPKQTASDTSRMTAEEKFVPPNGYNDSFDHHRNFIQAIREKRKVVEDSVFGFRAAGAALLANVSYFEKRVCLWDAETMTLKA